MSTQFISLGRTGPFQVGDIVEVVRPGATYSSYHDGFHALGFQNPEDEHDPFKTGSLAKVTGCYPHPSHEGKILVACVTEDGEEGIIGDTGLKLSDKFQVTKSFSKPEGWLCESYPVYANKSILKVGCQTINTANLAELIAEMAGMGSFTPVQLAWMQRGIEACGVSK